MRCQLFSVLTAALVAGTVSVQALPFDDSDDWLGTRNSIFESSIHSGTNLRCVANSGICETTPGVTQYSGYIDVGTNMSMWFWFFEARNSPETAPFTLWLNGGPGCSSMAGLFQENGPCSVNADGGSTSLNPYSDLYQPIGAGFSYGTDIVNSTEAAAPFVWKALQILFESQLFFGYASRDCNWLGGYGTVLAMDWYGNETFHSTPLSNITLDGEPIAVVANVDNFSFAIFAAGHEVPAFQPVAALETFTQVIYKYPLHSV